MVVLAAAVSFAVTCVVVAETWMADNSAGAVVDGHSARKALQPPGERGRPRRRRQSGLQNGGVVGWARRGVREAQDCSGESGITDGARERFEGLLVLRFETPPSHDEEEAVDAVRRVLRERPKVVERLRVREGRVTESDGVDHARWHVPWGHEVCIRALLRGRREAVADLKILRPVKGIRGT